MAKSTKNIHPFFLMLFFIFAWLAETAGEVLLLRKTLTFILGRNDDEPLEINWTFWLGFGTSSAASIPYVLTMLYYLQSSHHEHHDRPLLIQATPDGNDEHHHHHHHGITHKIGEVVATGVPFGLFAYCGVLPITHLLLKPNMQTRAIIDYFISGASGFADTLGNYSLHSSHLHAKESLSTLYKKLPNNTMKFYGSLLAASVIIGHLCQGGLDGMTFADTINKEAEPWVKLAVAGGLGLLVTIFEGHTEMRSALLNLTNNEQYHDIRALSKLLLMPAAAFHGLIPTVGLLEIVTSIYKIITHTTLPNSLMIRIPLFIGSSIVVGLANGKTFHDATVPTFNRTVNAIDYKFSQIQKTWHRQNQREEKQPLIRDIHVESGLVFN